jgi:hypothetical protein
VDDDVAARSLLSASADDQPDLKGAIFRFGDGFAPTRRSSGSRRGPINRAKSTSCARYSPRINGFSSLFQRFSSGFGPLTSPGGARIEVRTGANPSLDNRLDSAGGTTRSWSMP